MFKRAIDRPKVGYENNGHSIGNKKAERAELFRENIGLIESSDELRQSLSLSVENQRMYADSEKIEQAVDRYASALELKVSSKRTLEAAREYRGMHVCILNFASATNPGGGVTKGANAQEESICRCSTLYSCLVEQKEAFYDAHRRDLESGIMKATYNRDCIYTPDVTVFRDDTTDKELNSRHWWKTDVISCCAPNMRRMEDERLNPKGLRRNAKLSESKLYDIHYKRAKRILDIAYMHGAEVMILGAFGCGAFQNSPLTVARVYRDVIRKYKKCFKAAEFAVYCTDAEKENYNTFKKIVTLSDR